MQWTAYLQQMTALLNGALSWLAGLSMGYFAIVVLALLSAVLLILRIARGHVPLPVFQTVQDLAKETVTAVKEISERRLEDAKKTVSPVDDAAYQIMTTLSNLVLALSGGAQVAAVAPAATAGVAAELARMQAQVAELQAQTGLLKSSDQMAAERARMKYGAPTGTPSGMPQFPYTHTPGGAPLHGLGAAEDDGGIG
jgi:signal transduction histidine kinase